MLKQSSEAIRSYSTYIDAMKKIEKTEEEKDDRMLKTTFSGHVNNGNGNIKENVVLSASYLGRGKLFYKSGEYPLAFKDFHRACNYDTNSAQALFCRSLYYTTFV